MALEILRSRYKRGPSPIIRRNQFFALDDRIGWSLSRLLPGGYARQKIIFLVSDGTLSASVQSNPRPGMLNRAHMRERERRKTHKIPYHPPCYGAEEQAYKTFVVEAGYTVCVILCLTRERGRREINQFPGLRFSYVCE